MRISAKALALLFALALLSLSVYSNSEHDRHLPYPSMAEVKSDYASYIGEKVSIFGSVVITSRGSGVVSSDGLNFFVSPLAAKVGDLVEVLGVLEENYRIAAERSLVYDRPSYYSTFLISLIGAALLAIAILKNWKIDLRKLRFVEKG